MTEKFCLKWNKFSSNVSKSFGLFRAADYLHDVTLVIDDHKQIAAHKLVLSASSEYFRNIFKNYDVKHAHPLLCLDEVTSADLQNILDYMYNGQIQIYHDKLDRFLSLAQRFRLEGLLSNKAESDKQSQEEFQDIDNPRSRNEILDGEVCPFSQPTVQVQSNTKLRDSNDPAFISRDVATEDEVEVAEEYLVTEGCSRDSVTVDSSSPQRKLDPVVPVAEVSGVSMRADDTFQPLLPGSADTMTPGPSLIIPDTSQLLKTDKKRRSTSKCCSICGKFLLNSLKLAQHKYRIHPKVPNKFECSICHSSFPYKHILVKHTERKHSGKWFQCEHCEHVNTFSREDNYKRHLSSVHKQS